MAISNSTVVEISLNAGGKTGSRQASVEWSRAGTRQEAVSRSEMVVAWPGVILEGVIRNGQLLDKAVTGRFCDGLDQTVRTCIMNSEV